MIERGEILTLEDDKQYVVASVVDIARNVYVYLIRKDDYKKYIIGQFIDDTIEDIEDPDLLETLLIKFNEDLKENLSNILIEYL